MRGGRNNKQKQLCAGSGETLLFFTSERNFSEVGCLSEKFQRALDPQPLLQSRKGLSIKRQNINKKQ